MYHFTSSRTLRKRKKKGKGPTKFEVWKKGDRRWQKQLAAFSQQIKEKRTKLFHIFEHQTINNKIFTQKKGK
jgi:hypothetical protein